MAHDPLKTDEALNSKMNLLAKFFADHGADLLAFCYRRLGNLERAEDARGRILLKASAHIATFTPDPTHAGATLRAWIFRIARNEIIDQHRTTRALLSLDEETTNRAMISPLTSSYADPENHVLNEESNQRVRELLLGLPEKQRAIVELRLSGLRGDEIATTLGLTLSAVKSAQYRAYQHLRSVLIHDPQERGHKP